MSFFSSLFSPSKRSPESKFETLRDDGVRAMQMGETPYAVKCLTAALELQHDLKAVALLAEAHLRMRDYAAAVPLLKEMVAGDAENVEVKLLLAQALGETKCFDEMKTVATELVAAHPEEARALYLTAEAEHGLNEDLFAIAHLTQAIELRADYLRARKLRAEVLKAMGQFAEMLADAEALVAADGENEEYLILLAEALAATGQNEAAVEKLEKVRALNPFGTEAVLQLGRLYELGTQWDKALALYDEAIELLPDFAGAYQARGGVKHHLKDDAGAAEDLKKALELAPEKAATLDGEYTNVENRMTDRYKAMNPYGF